MITLDIEDTCIRMIEVKGRRVEKAASLPLEPGLVEDGVILDTVTVSQHLKELMTAHSIAEKQVIVSISGIHSIYRVASIPRLPGKMLAEAAKREMDRVMPVPLNELYASWQTIPVSDMETAIYMVGLPRNTIDVMLETLHQAGLQSRIMDIKPLALARVADEKDAIIINIQPASFDIVVMIDGIPELLRSLPFPSESTSAPDKAAVVKEELGRTVTFYNSSRKGNPITASIAVFISGELRETLAETLDYPVKPLPELLSYPKDFDASEYTTNIGLALKEVKAGKSQVRVNINVVPETYLPKPRPIIEIVSWAFILVAIAVLGPLAILTSQAVSETLSLQAQVNNARIQVQVRQETKAAIEKLEAQLEEAKVKRDFFQQPLDDLEAQRAMVNNDLSKVTSLLPATIDLESINYTVEEEENSSTGTEKPMPVEITIIGTAPDEATILSYCQSLRDTGRFSEVTVSNMEEAEYNEWDFTLTLE